MVHGGLFAFMIVSFFFLHKTIYKGSCFALLLFVVAGVWLWLKRGNRRRASLVLMGIILMAKSGGGSIWKGDFFFSLLLYSKWSGFHSLLWILLLGCKLWLRLWKQWGNMDWKWSLFARLWWIMNAFVNFENFVGFVLILTWECCWLCSVDEQMSFKNYEGNCEVGEAWTVSLSWWVYEGWNYRMSFLCLLKFSFIFLVSVTNLFVDDV